MYVDIYYYVFLDAEVNAKKESVLHGKPVMIFHNADYYVIKYLYLSVYIYNLIFVYLFIFEVKQIEMVREKAEQEFLPTAQIVKEREKKRVQNGVSEHIMLRVIPQELREEACLSR